MSGDSSRKRKVLRAAKLGLGAVIVAACLPFTVTVAAGLFGYMIALGLVTDMVDRLRRE